MTDPTNPSPGALLGAVLGAAGGASQAGLTEPQIDAEVDAAVERIGAPTPRAGTELNDLREIVRRIAVEAQVITARHPSCGAVAHLRYRLRELPPELRPADGDLPPHPEDDDEDRRAELVRLRRDLREARQAAGPPALFELGGGDHA